MIVGLRSVLGDVALPSAARAAGVYTGGPVANAGLAADVVLLVHVTATAGTATLACAVEESADGLAWSPVPGSNTPTLVGPGNATANAQITKNYARVTATVAGTSPSVTFRAFLMVIPE